jgi:alpha-tubulin suppressor-like RCC1 family protein
MLDIVLSFPAPAATTIEKFMYVWGSNRYGQLGDPSIINTAQSWTAVALGNQVAAAIKTDGTLWTWGNGSNGGLGDGTTTSRNSPVQIGTSSWTAITGGGVGSGTGSASGTWFIAIRNDGTLWAWGGNNLHGQLGQGTSGSSSFSSPVQIGTSSWTAVASNGRKNSVMAIRADGGLFTWGLNDQGQLGLGDTTNRSSPVQVGTASWTAIASGFNHTLAIRSDGALFTWGSNAGGQAAYPAPPTLSWTEISTNYASSIGITNDGKLYTWGNNAAGQLGLGNTTSYSTPQQVGSNTNWTKVRVGNQFMAALAGNVLYTWGLNSSGQLGLSDTTNRSSPVALASVASITQTIADVTCGENYTIAKNSLGQLLAFGAGTSMASGLGGSTMSKASIVGEPGFVSIEGSTDYTMALHSDGTVWAWGKNTNGKLGLGDTTDRSVPTQIPAFTNVKKISLGKLHATALKHDETAWVWGDNTTGRLGLGGSNVSTPTQLAGSWRDFTAGDSNTWGVRTNGTLWGWGLGTDIGNNSATNASSPVQIGAGTDWNKIYANIVADANRSIVFALKNDGATFAWGRNNYGQLGLGNTTDLSSPVQLGSDKWLEFVGGPQHTIALRNDWTAWSWGTGSFRRLGNGGTSNTSSPTSISGGGSWVSIGSNPYGGFAIDTSGQLWAWGLNDSTAQNLGWDESVDFSSSPRLVGSAGTKTWKKAAKSVFVEDATRCGGYAIDHTGVLHAWGTAGHITGSYRLGTWTSPTVATYGRFPMPIATKSWTAISAANDKTLALYDSKLYAWGNSKVTGENYEVFSDGLERWKQIEFTGRINGAYWYFMGLKSDGTIWEASYSNKPLTQKSTPGKTFKYIAAGWFDYYFAIDQYDKLWAWGNNDQGQLGLGNTTSQATMVQVGNDNWEKVYTGGNTFDTGYPYPPVKQSAAIRKDGALFTWGANSQGQLGLGDTSSVSSPVQVGTASYTMISMALGTMALQSNGTLWAWGDNRHGQLGINDTTTRSSPVQVGASTWTAVSIMERHAAAIRSDGALFTWGDSALGDGGAARSSPVQIGSDSWVAVKATRTGWTSNGHMTYAVKSDNTLWAWGSRLQSSSPYGATPVQINIVGSPVLAQIRSISGQGQVEQVVFHEPNGYAYWMGRAGIITYESRQSEVSSPTILGGFRTQNISPRRMYPMATTQDQSVFGGTNLIFDPNDTTSFTMVSAAKQNLLALSSTGKAYITGRAGNYGVLGNSFYYAYPHFQITQADKTFSKINIRSRSSSPYTHPTAIGITTDGQAFAWGARGYGMMGIATEYAGGTTSPIQLGTGSSYTMISSSHTGTVFLLGTTGVAEGFGTNGSGELGINVTASVGARSPLIGVASTSELSPVQFGTDSWTAVAAGMSHSVGIKSNGTLYTWGSNSSGQLGLGNTTAVSTPTQVGGLTNWQKLSANGYGTMAINTDGALYVWGSNNQAQLGLGDTTNRSSPVQLGSASWILVKGQDAGYSPIREYTFGIQSDNLMYAWGWLGTGAGGVSGEPADVGTLSSGSAYTTPNKVGGALATTSSSTSKLGTDVWKAASAGANHTVAIRTNGTLYAWGLNSSGQLGLGDTTIRSSPVQIGTSSWTAVSAGDAHTVAIRSDGGLFVWGNNGTGRLGDGTATSRSSPVQVGADSWTAVAAGGSHSVAVRKDGGLFAWGLNNVGQLGLSNTTNLSSPVQVGADSWTSVAAGASHTVSVRSDGGLFAWGLNNVGQLGLSNTTNLSSPVQVGADSWTLVTAGNQHTAGIRTNKLLYAWGRNNYGQLGLNDLVDTSSPVQVGTGSWTVVEAGNWHTVGVRSTNRLYAWGYNANGQLGDGTTTTRSSPVQIGSDIDHLTASAGGTHTITLKTV